MKATVLMRRVAALAGIALVAAACSDSPSAPQSQSRPPQPTPPVQVPSTHEDAPFYTSDLQAEAYRGTPEVGKLGRDDTGDADLVIDPNVSRVYSFGQNWVYFPARSICDPATSGYGPALWDAPCTPISAPITVHVKWDPRGGHAWAKFTPELRFVPSANIWNWVILAFHDKQNLRDTNYNILYEAPGDSVWVDESVSDPTLRAWVDAVHKTVYRRVKHFSGYMLNAGFTDMTGGLDASY